MAEIKKIQGLLELEPEINENNSSASFKIDNYFYRIFRGSSINPQDFEKGDFVKGEYEEKPNPNNARFPYRNLKILEKAEKPKDYEEKQQLKEHSIVRQACFKAACDTYKITLEQGSLSEHIENILAIAKAGEEYARGIPEETQEESNKEEEIKISEEKVE